MAASSPRCFNVTTIFTMMHSMPAMVVIAANKIGRPRLSTVPLAKSLDESVFPG